MGQAYCGRLKGGLTLGGEVGRIRYQKEIFNLIHDYFGYILCFARSGFYRDYPVGHRFMEEGWRVSREGDF